MLMYCYCDPMHKQTKLLCDIVISKKKILLAYTFDLTAIPQSRVKMCKQGEKYKGSRLY